ncbi:MAG: UDP-3-O-[Campylobacter sp.]|nr:UDP-3-O-[3-hydroxymyristoyl] N-acetylglucosamine deacetylase [Campylobacter sp.]
KLTPSTNPKFNYTIKFENPVIGLQSYTFEFSKENFINQIARARTFGFLKDVQKLNSMGLALGGSLDNAVVIDGGKILNPEGLRFENEFVRHKILDAIGDISLLGAPMIGDYEAFAGSHDLNHKLTLALLSDEKNYEIITLSEATQKEYEKAFA